MSNAEIANYVADYLQNAKVLSVNYKWNRGRGDINFIVEGILNGEPIVVIGEIKREIEYNLCVVDEDNLFISVFHLSRNCRRWKNLCDLKESPLIDSKDYIDYTSLHIAEFKDRRVVVALSGSAFTDDLNTHINDEFFEYNIFKDMSILEWIKIDANGVIKIYKAINNGPCDWQLLYESCNRQLLF